MTAADLARRAGMSAGMVSRIESGQVSPSLRTLGAVAEALSVPAMALFAQGDGKADVHHLKAGGGIPSRRITPNHAHEYLLLGKHGGPGGSFEAARVRIVRDEAGELPRYRHDGHVFLAVVSGEALYACGDAEFELAPGDTMCFDAKLEHGVVEIRSRDIEFVTVSSRPD